ncbi:MAG: DNA-protecting protein DprA [Lentisphaerae bacterium]|nr:DNA-protecting protein DprA [Lentisphaerota bacterium]
MTERELCIALNMISGLGCGRYQALLDAFGSPDEIRKAERADLQQVDGIGKILAERIVSFDWDSELSRELAVAERGGVSIITLADDNYPIELREIFDSPLCLYIRGNLPENSDRSVAIVGSRRISKYGEKMARQLAREAVDCGCTVFSGLAQGTDTVVHQEVVSASGVTIGVLGSGLMHMYPKDNIPLARDIIRCGGAVISEFPLNYPISRHNFPRRNRIVAALCRATIVVEAGLDSGALITAKLASEIGREVFAVPGRVDNPQAKGCLKLIKEGAGLIESFDDVRLAFASGMHSVELSSQTESAEVTANLSDDCRRIYDLLRRKDNDLEGLQELSGMEPGLLMSVLSQLEFRCLIERDSDFYYRLVRE